MKIIVFGARGEVGSRIVAEATTRGHDVTAVIRSSTQMNGKAPTVQTVVADITDTTALPSLLAGYDLAGCSSSAGRRACWFRTRTATRS